MAYWGHILPRLIGYMSENSYSLSFTVQLSKNGQLVLYAINKHEALCVRCLLVAGIAGTIT